MSSIRAPRAGARLPPTRELARDLGVSRNPVTHAYEQLKVEGYVTARVGSGTRVVENLPDRILADRGAPEVSHRGATPPVRLSEEGRRLAGAHVGPTPSGGVPGPFRPGAISLEHFPARAWSRLMHRVLREDPAATSSYGDPLGHRALRHEVVAYLKRSRAVASDPECVLITSGTQQALDLAARLLAGTGERVGLEDPCYLGARGAFEASGAEIVPIPVDADGISTPALNTIAKPVRVIYTTPSHQYPLGVTMTAPRRLELLDYARRHEAWVIEDDYDSQFRYASDPLPALRGLDEEGRVLYVGTFSKILSPAIRLGYLVLPPSLVAPFRRARQVADHNPEVFGQAALAAFMADGLLDRHIRRMRTVYRERRDVLRDAVERDLEGLLELGPTEAGIHVVGWLPSGTDDRRLASSAGRLGSDPTPLSEHCLTPGSRPGLVIGYGAAPPEQIRRHVAALARAIAEADSNNSRARRAHEERG